MKLGVYPASYVAENHHSANISALPYLASFKYILRATARTMLNDKPTSKERDYSASTTIINKHVERRLLQPW